MPTGRELYAMAAFEVVLLGLLGYASWGWWGVFFAPPLFILLGVVTRMWWQGVSRRLRRR